MPIGLQLMLLLIGVIFGGIYHLFSFWRTLIVIDYVFQTLDSSDNLFHGFGLAFQWFFYSFIFFNKLLVCCK